MAIKTDSSAIIEAFKRDSNYKKKMGFATLWPELVRFVEGDQWPPVTPKTKHMPRLTINQCDFVVESRSANILGQSISLQYKLADIPTDMDEAKEKELNDKADDYTNLAENTWDNINQTQLNKDLVEDALVMGNGIVHYYYDEEYTSGNFTVTRGQICGHTVHPLDIAFSNPLLKPHEINKQEFIIIRTYEDTESVKEQAKKGGQSWHMINSDKNVEEYNKNDIDQSNRTTCYTMYYFEKGEIYWTKVTEGAVVQVPRRLSATEEKFKVYPIEHLVFKRKVMCTYGRSVIQDIIPVQKGINFLYSMLVFGVQQTAWPKILAKAGALIQSITNEPGEVITDARDDYVGDAIKYMQPPNFSNMPPVLIDKLTESLRQTTGANEVNTGEKLASNMAAAAIIALQNQAKKPNEKYTEQLFSSQKRIGTIWENFFKCYYILPRPVISHNDDGKMIKKVITPSKYSELGFKVIVDVGANDILNESLQTTIVESLYAKKDIDKYAYVKYLPENSVPIKMKKDFEKEKKAMIEQAESVSNMAKQNETPNIGNPVDDLLNGLSEEERAHLIQNPQILNELGVRK